MCLFICMHCIFCPLSIFTWMSDTNQSEPPCILCLLQACPAQDSIFTVAQSSCSPLFLTHTSNPLASSVGSFFKLHLNPGTFHRTSPCPQLSCFKPQLLSGSSKSPRAVSPLWPGPPHSLFSESSQRMPVSSIREDAGLDLFPSCHN